MPGGEQILAASSQMQSMDGGQFFATTLQPINLKSPNMAKEWKLWYTQFKIFMTASNLETQADRRKVALLLHHLGCDCLEIFNSFNEDVDTIAYSTLVNKFESFFIPKVNIAMERHKFFICRQQPGQGIDEYVTILKNLSLNCEFGSLREDLVRDIFTCGLSPKMGNIRERLLSEGGIPLDRAIAIAKSIAMAKENAMKLEDTQDEEPVVNMLRKKTYKSTTYNKQQVAHCSRCGQVHKNKCPAEGVKCHNCGKSGHFAKMCFMKKRYVKNVNINEDGDCNYDEEEEDLFIGALSKTTNSTAAEWNIEVGIKNNKMVCQIDTGAQANIMSTYSINKLNIKCLLKKTKVNIFTFSGEKLSVVGSIDLKINHENQTYILKFFVVDMMCRNIIGLQSAIEMNLVKNVNILSVNKIFENYSDVFGGLGLLRGECNLKIRNDVPPVIDPPRKIPFRLYDPLKMELNRMMNLNVIKKVDEPTEWVNSIVLVSKSNGSLRLCLDPRNLNRAILRPHFPFPNIEDCKAKLSGSKYFSSLDANSGFWMIPLSEQSSKLCTFNTPFGRYRFLRLPFGINAAPEIFHAEMVKLFGDIPGLIIYIDDFLIYSSTEEEHFRILELVLQRAKDVGIRFNKSKCTFFQTEIRFLGHIFDNFGVKPDVDKVKSIFDMPKPRNVKELQRFLGMVNYLGAFIENLAFKNKNLRELLKNHIEWHWSEKHELEFENLKSEITKSPVLTYFDPNKELTLSVDASKFALGAAIMHDRHPIAYASVSLTESQQNYAQIEKELFAILFGCTRFHQFVYGSRVLVETDHKPLVSLFDKPLYKIPARLQRFMLRLQLYNLSVVYKPGKDLQIADTLSRAPLSETTLGEIDEESSLHCNFVSSCLETPFTRMDILREHTGNDETFKKILIYVENGWPSDKKKVEPVVMPYYRIKDEISVLGGILLRNHQILIPESLRSSILSKIHEGHMGIQRCKDLARQSVYWPNLYNDIENVVSNCEICMRYQNSKTKSKMVPHEIMDMPWFKLGCDLFEFNRKTYLIVVDYYSKYIEIELLNSGYNSSQVILKLKSIFSRHGIPFILVTDNGPPYNSRDFKDFCHNWGIEHNTSSPYLARSNGLAERSVQIIKKMLLKSQESHSDPYMALLQYRTTSKGNLPSPSELLMSRSLRTKIPSILKNLRPKVINRNEYSKKLNSNIQKYADYYNQSAKRVEPLQEGDNVIFRKTPTSCWFRGQIINSCKEPSSFIVKDSNGTFYRRSQDHIRKTPENKIENSVNQECQPNSQNSVQVTSTGNNDSKEYVTRKGRIVKQPKKLNL